ncbi:hypothetical protein N9137_00935 [Pseudomonadales bacterium]|nr:hypothetical protein [Pseudomonadales bacterium]
MKALYLSKITNTIEGTTIYHHNPAVMCAAIIYMNSRKLHIQGDASYKVGLEGEVNMPHSLDNDEEWFLSEFGETYRSCVDNNANEIADALGNVLVIVNSVESLAKKCRNEMIAIKKDVVWKINGIVVQNDVVKTMMRIEIKKLKELQ